MCGIAGAIIYDERQARLDCLLSVVDASSARGRDSFGIVRWSPSSGFRRLGMAGRDVAGFDWLDVIGRPASQEPTVFLHTSRAEPTTEWVLDKSDDDIPPFVSQGIAVAHNGIVANDDRLAQTYQLSRESPIDTAVIPGLVARLGVWRAIAALEGGAALAILDSASGRLVLCRNFMPLVLAWQPGIVCFASEAAFFPHARNPFPPFELWEMPPFSAIELSAAGFRGPVKWGEEPPADEHRGWQAYPSLTWSD